MGLFLYSFLLIIMFRSLVKIYRAIRHQPGVKHNFPSFVIVYLLAIGLLAEFSCFTYWYANMHSIIKNCEIIHLIRDWYNYDYLWYSIRFTDIVLNFCALYMIFSFKVTTVSREFNTSDNSWYIRILCDGKPLALMT